MSQVFVILRNPSEISVGWGVLGLSSKIVLAKSKGWLILHFFESQSMGRAILRGLVEFVL